AAELSTDVGLRLVILLLVQVVGMGIEPREHALQRILGKHIHLDRANVVALDFLDDPSDEFEIAQGRGGGDIHQGNGGKTQYGANGDQLGNSHGPTLVPSLVSSAMRRLPR